MTVEGNSPLSPYPSSLQAKRILITRAAAQAQSFVDIIKQYDGVPVLFPTIRTAAVPHNNALQNAIAHLEKYDWLIFTSRNAVEFFMKAAAGHGILASGVQVACVGAKTAAALSQYGIVAEAMPEEFASTNIADELGVVTNKRILLPQSEIARPELARALAAAGAHVEAIVTYRTIPNMPSDEAYDELEKGFDVATFTSPSTVDNFLYLTGRRGRELLTQALIACIGPTTAAAVNEAGFSVAIMPEEYTVEGLVTAIIKSVERGNGTRG